MVVRGAIFQNAPYLFKGFIFKLLSFLTLKFFIDTIPNLKNKRFNSNLRKNFDYGG
ncbi:hypothetical protein N405_06560 [Helicobacter pylori FD568]|nr:hypothetical protein N405_06560 [Helicobacter pylori FD568]